MNNQGTIQFGEDQSGAVEALGGRLGLLAVEELSEIQRQIYDVMASEHIPKAVEAGYIGQLPDGRMVGLYNVLLAFPELSSGIRPWMEAQAACGLSDEVREVVILAVGAKWQSEYQIYAHTAVARHIGLCDETVASILQGRQPTGVSMEAAVGYRLASSLVNEHRVPDALYADAVRLFTISEIAAIVHLVGLYMTVSALLNCFNVPAPPGT